MVSFLGTVPTSPPGNNYSKLMHLDKCSILTLRETHQQYREAASGRSTDRMSASLLTPRWAAAAEVSPHPDCRRSLQSGLAGSGMRHLTSSNLAPRLCQPDPGKLRGGWPGFPGILPTLSVSPHLSRIPSVCPVRPISSPMACETAKCLS